MALSGLSSRYLRSLRVSLCWAGQDREQKAELGSLACSSRTELGEEVTTSHYSLALPSAITSVHNIEIGNLLFLLLLLLLLYILLSCDHLSLDMKEF